MRLMIRLGALEARQKRVVNVDHLAEESLGQVIGQHLHVARQHHQVCAGSLDQLQEVFPPAPPCFPWSTGQ